MARSELLEPNRIADVVRQPQMALFTISLLFIAIACFAQFDYLYHEFWSVTDGLSKGPLIWVIAISIIFLDLSRCKFKVNTTDADILLTLIFVLVLVSSVHFDPLVAPTLLVIFAWYMVSTRVDLERMLIVWLLLLFSLPYYSQWVLGLQLLTVNATEGMLGLLGLPVLVQEYYIAIPRGQFVIAEGCGGVRYLTSNLLLFFLYSLFRRFGFYQFFLGLLVTISLGLLINWIRVVSIILFGQYFGIDHDFVQNHENYGWFLYAMQLVPFYYLLSKLDRPKWKKMQIYQPNGRHALSIPSIALTVAPLLLVLWQQPYL